MRLPFWLIAITLVGLGCGDDKATDPSPDPDTTPPAAVDDLAIVSSTGSSLTLSWTAPGDDGEIGRASEYDLRFSADSLTAENWDSATRVTNVPLPLDAGSRQTATAPLPSQGSNFYAIRTADEVPNWSALSNVVRYTVRPAQVTDLAVVEATRTSVSLSWTAPGHSGTEGRAAEYDLRHSTVPIDSQNWGDAVRVTGLPVPGPAGSSESFTVTGLEPATIYYFALQTADDVPNWSALSNVVEEITVVMWRLVDEATANALSRLVWSPDGSMIYFNSSSPEYGFFRVRLDGSAPELMVAEYRYASISPDGNRIAFGNNDPGPRGLFVMDAVPGAQAVHLAGDHRVAGTSWSVNDIIAYSVPTGMTGIYIVPSTGGDPERLTRFGGWPDWSRDGTKIAFSHDNAIWVVSPGEMEPLRVAEGVTASWSSDDSRFAYTYSVDGTLYGRRIWIMGADGGNQVRMTVRHGMLPAWSPDGSRIAFVSRPRDEPTAGFEIWIMEME